MKLSDTVTADHQGDTLLIYIDNPPVNAASYSVRQGLAAAVDWLRAHPEVKAAALYGAGRTFVAGADIREFGAPPRDPWLPEVCNMLENCPTPIACILHGTTLGGGLEIALACHVRLALPGTRIGLPEVLLGILPGAGGTQRAPRLAGMATALDMITTGQQVPVEQALTTGLIDHLTDNKTPAQAAQTAARALADGTLAHRRTGKLRVTPDAGALEAARTRIRDTQPHLFSPLKCVDAIAASVLPLQQGLAQERALFNACHDSPQRAGLVHAFFAERAVSKVPEAGAIPRPFDHIGVVGAGTMGGGIAAACLLAGLRVTLTDQNTDRLEFAVEGIGHILGGAVKRGKLAPEDLHARKMSLATVTSLDGLSDCDLVIEAAFEDMDVKQTIFRQLDAIAKPGAVLATNTSYLDVAAIAQATQRPGEVIGLHFFSPAHIMRLTEVVVPDNASPDAAATGFALAKRLRKIAVRAGVCDGFIGNRILRTTRRAVEYMMLDGAAFADIDSALERFGLAMGPFRVSDMAGLDIAGADRKRRAPTGPAGERYVQVPDHLCAAGMLGRKTGAGYYMPDGKPNPTALHLITQERAEKGIVPRTFDPDTIVTRYLTAMIMEAAQIVEDGIALRPIDVDAVLLFGYGFPRHRGGPLHCADQISAQALVDRITDFANDDPQFWQVPDILRDMATNGARFADRNITT